MKKRIWVGCALVVSLGFGISACEGDDVTEGPADAGPEGSTTDGSFSEAGADGAVEAGPVRPPWALYSFNYADQSDMAAFSLDAGAFDGVLTYSGKIGLTSIATDGPWLLEQLNDVVVKLDPSEPWLGGPSWNVRGTDDGGFSYADPVKVVAGPSGKAYVPRFNRNEVAVIDTTQTGNESAPTKMIDLSQYLEGTDEDGEVDMVSAVYVASSHRLYVLLANFDLFLTDPVGFFTICGTTHSKVVAIDTDTDTLVSGADGGADTTAITLSGYNAIALYLDAPRNRLLAVHAGCNDPGVPDSGIPGALHMREIDAVDLTTGAAMQALDLDTSGYPSALAFVDATHLAIGFDFGFSGNMWDVTTTALGPTITNAPDVFAYDGRGHLVGAKTDFFADGGQATSLVSVSLDDGGVTNFGPPPLRQAGFVGAVDIWSP